MSIFEDQWNAWIRRFWWLRGVAAAMSLAALVPNFIDLSRYEFLRALHAVIVGWNLIAEKLGHLIGTIPFLPALSSEAINIIIFGTSVGIPVSYAFSMRYISEKGANSYYHIFIALLLCPMVFLFVMACYFSLIFEVMPVTHRINFEFIEVGSLIFIGSYLLFPLIYLPGYGKGAIYLITFFLTIEVLYLINTPWLADEINRFACEAIEVPPESCTPRIEGP